MGDMDQVVHLWRYTGGFEAIDQAKVRGRGQHRMTPLDRSTAIRLLCVCCRCYHTLFMILYFDYRTISGTTLITCD